MNNDTITALRFHANWCLPCKALEGTLKKVLPEFPNVVLKEIDIDEDVEQAREFKVRSIPTIILLKDNQEIGRLVGNQDSEKVRKFLTR